MARAKQEKDGFVVNPNTGRYVKIGSATYKKLVKNGEIEAKTPKSPKPKKVKGKKDSKSPKPKKVKGKKDSKSPKPKKKMKSPMKKVKKQPKKPIEKEMMHRILDDLTGRDYFLQMMDELLPNLIEYYNDENDNDENIDLEATVIGEDGEEEELRNLLHSELLDIFWEYIEKN